jgi:hypothetical protein
VNRESYDEENPRKLLVSVCFFNANDSGHGARQTFLKLTIQQHHSS